jgi:hypothetical protein
MKMLIGLLGSFLVLFTLLSFDVAAAHGPGPGMLVGCTSGVVSGGATVVVYNAATDRSQSIMLAGGFRSSDVCVAVLKAAGTVGFRGESETEKPSTIAIYGSGISITVSGASISQQNF